MGTRSKILGEILTGAIQWSGDNAVIVVVGILALLVLGSVIWIGFKKHRTGTGQGIG